MRQTQEQARLLSSSMYHRGHADAQEFAYVPDFADKQEEQDYCKGFADGKQFLS